jgi:stearoyl-CoA desaturase (Delta-9 desaturase)
MQIAAQPPRQFSRRWQDVYFHRGTTVFWGFHVGAIAGIATLGWSWKGLALAILLYGVRMFLVTAVNHRYFSHRSYRTSRWFQLVLAVAAVATGQKGVVWWAAHHRRHHRFSDEPEDVHSPVQGGFWWSHIGWMLSREFEETDLSVVKDLARYRELMWLNKYWIIPPVVFNVAIWALGGSFGLVWGVFLSQVLFWHGTFTINSLAHVIGSRRFETKDDSRNHWLLALITFGEGWHNNHHHRPGLVRQGLRWWEIDASYYILRMFAAVGLVWDLRGANDAEDRPRRAIATGAGGGDDAPAPTRQVA